MLLGAFRHKLAHIDRVLARSGSPRVRALPEAIYELVEQTSSDGRSASARQVLALDLLYVVSRHSSWLATPIFTEVFAAFVASEHALPRSVAEDLAEKATDTALRSFAPEELSFDPNDDEFLRYVFVESALARDEAFLKLDLGFGGEMLLKLRAAMAHTGELSLPSVGAARFVPELEAKLAAVVIDLAQELKHAPSAMETHRLKYLLARMSEPWKKALRVHGASFVFELLIAVGARKRTTAKQVEKDLGRITGQPRDFANGENFLDELARLGLVFKDLPTGYWHLTDVTEELTATAFARRFAQAHAATPATLASLLPRYQQAIISIDDRLDGATLRSLVVERREFAPQCVGAALERLAATDAATTIELIVTLLQSDSPPWIKQAACKAARPFSADTRVGQLLERMAYHDPSANVRDAAREAKRGDRSETRIDQQA